MITVSISIVGTIVAVILFLAAHVGTLLWFMSKISTIVVYLQRDLTKLSVALEKFDEERYTTKDSVKDWKAHAGEHRTLWQRIEDLRKYIETHKEDHRTLWQKLDDLRKYVDANTETGSVLNQRVGTLEKQVDAHMRRGDTE